MDFFLQKLPFNLFMIMRLTIFTLTLLFAQIALAAYTQKVSVSFNEASLKSVISELSNNSDYTFLYNQKYLVNSKAVSITATNESIENVINRVFAKQPFIYQIVDRTITLKPKQELILQMDQQQGVSGRVADSLNNPLIGASVRVKGSKQATVTNSNGNFSFENLDKDAILVISFLGYLTEEVSVTAGPLAIVLKDDHSMLEDVMVVVGFGSQKKVNLTGAVDQITADQIEARPVANMGQALQGVSPNLNIGISNGSPYTTPSINIRGGTSFAKNSSGNYEFQTGSPLILVDGVEMDINQLNPEDVASVSVLKDAASAAIYGARAAYGVMLITTKKGSRSGGAKVTYSNSFQWNKPSNVPDLLDAYTIQLASIQALELENKSASTDMLLKLDKIKAHMDNPSQEPNYYMDPGSNIIWVANTDVYDLALKNYAPMQKHNLNLSGGNEKTSYYASVGLQDQDGFYKINNDKFNRYNVMLNVTSDVNDWFTTDFRTSYNNSDYVEPVSPAGKGGWWSAMSQEPFRNINMPVKTPADSPVGEMYTDNILAFMDYGSSNQQGKETILLSASPTIKPLRGWNIKGDFSYKSYNYSRKQVVPELERIENRWDAPTTVHTSPTYVQKWKQHSDQYTLNVYTDYSYSLPKHEFYALAGYNQEWYTYNYLGGKGEGILSPSIPVIGQTLGNQYAYDEESHWAIRGAFFRLTYNYDNKYLLESNGRYDGTSRFPKDSRFKFFASYSGAWRVTEEKFAQSIKPVVNELKLRASYGSLGNQDVANYIYIPSYGTTTQVQHLFDGVRPVGVTPPGLVDPYLTWETASTLDFGVDMTLFRKLDITFDWYRRNTTDILVAGDKFPAVLGTSAPTKNSGAMKTVGWELSTKWKDRLEGGFSYDIALNLSGYQSEITSFDGNPNNLLSTLYVGQKMGEIWGYETVGIFQSQEQIDAAPSQALINSGIWYPGDIQYRDLNGDGKIGPGANTVEDSGDRKIIGNSNPRYRFGLNMNAAYRGFDLNVFLQGVGKRDYWIGHSLYWGAIAGGTGTKEVYENSWTPERTDAHFPAYKGKGANIQTQTRFMKNAAYTRLKNIAIGYTIPKEYTQSLKIDRIRVYGSAYNIWESTKVPKVFDPEMMSANYPMMRSLAFGLQVTF